MAVIFRVVSKKPTTIRVSQSTKERLKEYGDMGMTYDDVVNKLLDRLEKYESEEEAQ